MTEVQPTNDISKLKSLCNRIEYHHLRLHDKNIKKSCTEERKALQELAMLCKEMRKKCLDHKKTIPTRKRKPKPTPETPPVTV